MPKVKWGGDDALDADTIDNAETGFVPYAGEIPPAGVYRFRLERCRKVEFNSGNPGLKNLLLLDGSWKSEHEQYDGCPLWDNLVATRAAAGFVKAFCIAIGVTSREFISSTLVDDEANVTKIGNVKVTDAGLLVYVNVKRGRQDADSPWRLERNGAGYIPVSDVADEDEKAAANGGKKAKKGKEKTKASKGSEPPF